MHCGNSENVSNDDSKGADDDHSPHYLHKRGSIKLSLLSLLDKGHLDPRGGIRKLFGVRADHEKKIDFLGNGDKQ